jgi:hypothetical protein
VEANDFSRMPSAGVLDDASARWLSELRASGPAGEPARQRLHAMLHGVARAEAFRRRGNLPAEVLGDLDDLCLQAANDGTVAVLRKLDRILSGEFNREPFGLPNQAERRASNAVHHPLPNCG